jgi:hypothetical protein
VQCRDQGQLVACHDETERYPKDDGEKTVVGAEGLDRLDFDTRKTGQEGKESMINSGFDSPGGKTLFFACSWMTNRLS